MAALSIFGSCGPSANEKTNVSEGFKFSEYCVVTVIHDHPYDLTGLEALAEYEADQIASSVIRILRDWQH